MSVELGAGERQLLYAVIGAMFVTLVGGTAWFLGGLHQDVKQLREETIPLLKSDILELKYANNRLGATSSLTPSDTDPSGGATSAQRPDLRGSSGGLDNAITILREKINNDLSEINLGKEPIAISKRNEFPTPPHGGQKDGRTFTN